MTNQIQINHYKNQYTSWSVGGDVTRTNAPGNIVPCVTSPTGYCRVTNTSTKDGKEWYLNTLTTKQDIEQAQQQLQVDSQKAQQSINKQGKELFWNGCMSSGFVGAGCQSYFVFGGKDPFTNKPLSNPERITLGAGLAVQAVGAGYNSIGSKAVNKAEKQAIKAEQTILNNPKKNVLDNIATSESAIKASKFTPDYLRKEAQVDVSNIFNGTRSYLKVGQNNFKVDIKESNKSNTTKVLDSSNIKNDRLQQDVFSYAEKLGGGKLQPTKDPEIWSLRTSNGTVINVRSKSTSNLSDGSKPRWTIDIKGDADLNQKIADKISKKIASREIKFK